MCAFMSLEVMMIMMVESESEGEAEGEWRLIRADIDVPVVNAQGVVVEPNTIVGVHGGANSARLVKKVP